MNIWGPTDNKQISINMSDRNRTMGKTLDRVRGQSTKAVDGGAGEWCCVVLGVRKDLSD
jgi:hypothetical protein